ncbi:hypothetical protein KAT08_01830 [Candidatus Babeliales bacterium]|nr:hypothetical protein [Candidatus Babeliales bacterium]
MNFTGFKIFKNKFFLSLILFLSIFLIFAFSIKQLWFKLDDIGTIVDGLIKNWNDFLKVFSTQSRDFTAPINYKFSKPNFISAIYRPLINIPYTIIYYFFGLDAYIFYLLNVFFHAINSVLLFYIFSFFMPVGLSFLGGFLFAFYREMSWLTWIAILNNVLSTFFLFITTILFLTFFLRSKKETLWCYDWRYYLSGFTLLLSFLSRETPVFFSFFVFCSIFFLCSYKYENFYEKIKYSFSKSWIFFLSNFVYVLIRIWAFGFETLDRTFNNFFIRFPFLKNIFLEKANVKLVNELSNNIVSNTVENVSKVLSSANTVNLKKTFFTDFFSEKIIKIENSFFAWIRSLFYVDIQSFQDKVLYFLIFLFLLFFLIFAYRKHGKVLLVLFLGFIFFAWPGFLAYPNTRYISSVYPILIFTVLFGLYLFCRNLSIKLIFRKSISFLIVLFLFVVLFAGIKKNHKGLNITAVSSIKRKEKYEKFFRENSFDNGKNFIVISSPFTSDIHSVFQYFLNNYSIKLSYVLFSTLANKGSMGCRGDYKVKGVESKIVSVKMDGKKGIRLISLNKQHCAWWMNFSDHPIKWSKKEKAYIWTDKKYMVDRWYDFSMGKFIINEMIGDKYVTDIIFIFDNIWVDENTVFVFWDTMEGKYKVLNIDKEIE